MTKKCHNTTKIVLGSLSP